MKRHGGCDGDDVSAAVIGGDVGGGLCEDVFPLVKLAAWWWLSTLLFLIWQFEVVDLNFFFFSMFSVSDLVVVLRVGHGLGSQVLGE